AGMIWSVSTLSPRTYALPAMTECMTASPIGAWPLRFVAQFPQLCCQALTLPAFSLGYLRPGRDLPATGVAPAEPVVGQVGVTPVPAFQPEIDVRKPRLCERSVRTPAQLERLQFLAL